MKTKLIIGSIIVIITVFFAVSSLLKTNTVAAYAASDEKAYSVNKELAASNTRFAFNIFKELNKEDGNKNIFISPFSISTALAMVYSGADGTTKEAMAQTLQFNGMRRETVEKNYADLIKSLEGADSQVKLSIANSVWISEIFSQNIKQTFTQKTKDSYDSEVFVRNFGKPETPGEINEWISKETNGKIDKMIDKINSRLVMFLINAIYFKGSWTDKFEEKDTRQADFYTSNGSIKVNMMYNKGTFGYYKGDNFAAAKLPYGRDKIAMYVFLPDEGVSLDSFVLSLNQENFEGYLSSFRNQSDLIVNLPKFKIEYGVKRLNDALKALGMEIAFSDNANFNGISDNGLAIDFVDHKAVVEVNEEGTEAAAVTVIGIIATGMPIQKTFIVDRPFFFVIRDDRSGTILFMGKIVEPTRA